MHFITRDWVPISVGGGDPTILEGKKIYSLSSTKAGMSHVERPGSILSNNNTDYHSFRSSVPGAGLEAQAPVSVCHCCCNKTPQAEDFHHRDLYLTVQRPKSETQLPAALASSPLARRWLPSRVPAFALWVSIALVLRTRSY